MENPNIMACSMSLTPLGAKTSKVLSGEMTLLPAGAARGITRLSWVAESVQAVSLGWP